MGLAGSWAHTGAGSAADAGARIGHRHDFALEFLIVIIIVAGTREIGQGAILRQALQVHHIAPANLEAAAAADTGLAVDGDEVVRLPAAAVAR